MRNIGRITSGQDVIRQDFVFQDMQNGRVGRTFHFEPTDTTTLIPNPVIQPDSSISLAAYTAEAAQTLWYVSKQAVGYVEITLINPEFSQSLIWKGLIIGQE